MTTLLECYEKIEALRQWLLAEWELCEMTMLCIDQLRKISQRQFKCQIKPICTSRTSWNIVCWTEAYMRLTKARLRTAQDEAMAWYPFITNGSLSTEVEYTMQVFHPNIDQWPTPRLGGTGHQPAELTHDFLLNLETLPGWNDTLHDLKLSNTWTGEWPTLLQWAFERFETTEPSVFMTIARILHTADFMQAIATVGGFHRPDRFYQHTPADTEHERHSRLYNMWQDFQHLMQAYHSLLILYRARATEIVRIRRTCATIAVYSRHIRTGMSDHESRCQWREYDRPQINPYENR
jgi:hypothetical protein